MSLKFEDFLSNALNKHESCIDEDILVVTLIGKDSSDWRKCDIFNEVVEASAFVGYIGDDPEIFIEAYFSEDDVVLYLVLHGIQNDDFLLELFDPSKQNKTFFEKLAEPECEETSLLHVIFILSHVIFFVEQGRYFDSHWLRTLSKVNQLRLKLNEDIKTALEKEDDLGKEWYSNGRLAVPRLCFLFPDKMVRHDLHIGKKKEIIDKLEVCWQNQINDVLKVGKLIDISLPESIGHLPESDKLHYVFVGKSPREEVRDVVASIVMKMTDTKATYGMDAENDPDCAHFIRNHIKEVYSYDYDKEYYYYFPTLKQFVMGAKVVIDRCMSKAALEASKIVPELNLVQLLEFSNSERAVQKYENVLANRRYLTEQEHLSEMDRITEFIKSTVSSDNVHQLIEEVTKRCNVLWNNGHRRCDAVSLTGHGCKRSVHYFDIPHNSDYRYISSCNCGRKQSTRNDPFTLKEANYDFYKGTFSCCSNDNFYYKLSLFVPDGNSFVEEKSYRRTYPVDNAISPDRKIKEEASDTEIANLSQPSIDSDDDENDEDEIGFDRYLDEDKLKEMFYDEEGEGISSTKSEKAVSVSDEESVNESEEDDTAGDYLETYDNHITGLNLNSGLTIAYDRLLRDYKGKFLEHMLHSKAPRGLLPAFPSWAIFCIGLSNRYSHNVGLKSPNFKQGSDYLLPLDHTITVRSDDWDADMKKIQKSGYKFVRNKNALDLEGTHREKLRFFIGFDYECPRGHRFVIERPGKCLNMDKSQGFHAYLEEAAQMLRSDIPVWTPCTCKKSPTVSAQLMRLHIVLPKGPIVAKLNLKIQPLDNQATDDYFYPSTESIELSQNRYYVVRFPFVYQGPEGSIHPPKSATTRGRLMKNWMTVEHRRTN